MSIKRIFFFIIFNSRERWRELHVEDERERCNKTHTLEDGQAKDRRLSRVEVVSYSRRGWTTEMKARASRGVREKRIIRGCSGLNLRSHRLSPRIALPAVANLREKLSRWNANLTRSRKLKRIVHRACDVL